MTRLLDCLARAYSWTLPRVAPNCPELPRIAPNCSNSLRFSAHFGPEVLAWELCGIFEQSGPIWGNLGQSGAISPLIAPDCLGLLENATKLPGCQDFRPKVGRKTERVRAIRGNSGQFRAIRGNSGQGPRIGSRKASRERSSKRVTLTRAAQASWLGL